MVKRSTETITDERAPRAVDAEVQVEEVRFERSLRPKTLDDYIGQTKHKDNLRVFVEASRRRGEPLDHLLLSGPPGLGKTTLAQILAHEMGVELHMTNGPVVEHKGALAGLLTKLGKNDILFIDEIHRLNPVVEESLYPAMEDFRIDVMTGDGAFASSIQIPVQPFTLIGATTRTGLLTAPLHSRFGQIIRLDEAIVTKSCERLDIDSAGFDEMDRRLLRVIIVDYDGGPVGVETLAAALGEPRDTIEDVYEPYLLQQGYLGRTTRGRVATRKAYEHLRLPFAGEVAARQKELFDE
jgi:Holliday junction DNA helicase RuvB